jgi:magnesium transporter
VIRAWIADETGAREVRLGEAHEAVRAGRGHVWVDLQDEGEQTVAEALVPFGVHPLVIEDMVQHVHRPKLDNYGEYFYVVVHSARWEKSAQRPSLREVDMVVSERWIVTCHDGATRSIVAAAETLPRRPELLAKCPAQLMHYLLDELVDHYLPIVDQLTTELDKLEDEVFDDDTPEMHARILRVKRGISALRRIIGPQRDTILALTRDELRAIPAELRLYLRDVYDRLARVADMLDSFRDESATVLELHLSAASNRMNHVIKRLTVIATVFLPLTVVTSYYGMNFRLPEYEWSYSEWYAIGLMVATALATWAYLKFRKWD